ncbi:MAG: ABC transporter ATP-binding protein [Actinobacteria bacterium]|nr:ABC transporter ATP-binding protein [Actinomycetota bacterium]
MGAVIEIEGVSKRFRLYQEKASSLKERVIKLGRLPYEEFWALRDIDIEVGQGETVGLLGHNGSGKSTLLKCVTGILRPTTGRIAKAGRVAALLELGSGMHPELTGRENIYMNGALLGLSRAYIDRIFDDIVGFSEIETFIDNQVKHYSSGMHARLAFAVAVNVDPEILVIDEVLAVGDEAFARKCIERIKQFQREGRTILLVTHQADMVRQICDRAAVLDHGNLVMFGPPGDAVLTFRDTLLKRGLDLAEAGVTPGSVTTKQVRIVDAQIVYPDPTRQHLLPSEPVRIRLQYDAREPVEDVVFAINIHDQAGNLLLGTNTEILGVDLGTVRGSGEVTFAIERVPLLDGVYVVSLGIHSHDLGTSYDHRDQRDFLEVLNPLKTLGLVHFPLHVEVSTSHGAEATF